MTILNKAEPGELEKRNVYTYMPHFLEEYKKCKQDLNCNRFTISVNRDINAGPIERLFVKCAKDNNLTLTMNYIDYNNQDRYEFSFA